jgi:hypothetical protein
MAGLESDHPNPNAAVILRLLLVFNLPLFGEIQYQLPPQWEILQSQECVKCPAARGALS